MLQELASDAKGALLLALPQKKPGLALGPGLIGVVPRTIDAASHATKHGILDGFSTFGTHRIRSGSLRLKVVASPGRTQH